MPLEKLVHPVPVHAPQSAGVWLIVRREAGIEGIRLHDLRHSTATHAVMRGVSLPVVARLLGHRHPGMTLRYTHIGDIVVEAAAERGGLAIARLMAGEAAGEELRCIGCVQGKHCACGTWTSA